MQEINVLSQMIGLTDKIDKTHKYEKKEDTQLLLVS